MADLLAFFPNGFDANKYAPRVQSDEPPNIAAWQFLTSLGYKPPFMQQGRLMRFPDPHDMAKGDKRGNGGWCLYNEHTQGDKTLGILSYGSWHDGSKETWSSVSQDYMDSGQRQAFLDAIDAARRIRDEEERKLKEKAREECVAIWSGLSEAVEHGYLTRKGVQAHGIKQDSARLVIPMLSNGALVGLQYIAEDGTKLFRKHSSKGWFEIQGEGDYVLICEGYSTGASLYESTGYTVIIAFDAGNLFPVTSEAKERHADKTLVIAADDDRHGDTNTGMIQAKRCADILGVRVICPKTEGTDFNDMAAEIGLDMMRVYINDALSIKQPKPRKADVIEDAKRPHGALGLIYDYYNATSGYEQRGFAIQTALAIGSVVCGRNFKTDNENYASIYLLNVGKTATGKEHCKTLINKIMRAAGQDNHIIGDGFTSAGGVMTELLRKPRCISVIDEFGMYLEAAQNKGNSNQKEANSYLMQALGRCHDVMMSKNYSAMTVKEKDMNDRKVCNPALSLVGLTTPRTFFDAINDKDIHSGFLNRFIVSVSSAEPSVRKQVEQFDVPDAITTWIEAIYKRGIAHNPIEVSADFSDAEVIRISTPAWEIQQKFDAEMVGNIIKYEPAGLDGLFGRAAEMAHRVALICALSRDPKTTLIADIDMQWACDYIRDRYMQLFEAAKTHMRTNDFERDRSGILEFIEAQDGMRVTRGVLFQKFRQFSTRQMDDLLKTLIEAGMLETETNAGKGRPTVWYIRTE